MKHLKRSHLSACLLASFALWTAAVQSIDVQAVGPHGSAVGFAALNAFFHNWTGVHMPLYIITDWLSLIPLAFAAGFALLGLWQWIRRKSILNVDRSILILGGFYAIVIAVYALFEVYIVNYRPVLIGGVLEASYPSSTTMLVLCVMPTAMMQLRSRMKAGRLRSCALSLIAAYTLFMVACRLISGVHWLTDIIAGILLSAGLVTLYRCAVKLQG